MRKIAAIIIGLAVGLCAVPALARNGQYLFREMCRTSVEVGAAPSYQNDPFSASLLARYDFDSAAWTNDVTTNGFHLSMMGFTPVVSNLVCGTNSLGRQEKCAVFSGGMALRRVLIGGEQMSWSNSDIVVSLWIYRDATNQIHRFGLFGSTNDITTAIMPNFAANSHQVSWLVRSNGTTLASDGYGQVMLTNGLWHHIVEYRSSLSAGNKVWINNKVVSGDGASLFRTFSYADVVRMETAAGRNPAVALGDQPSRTQQLKGKMDNVKFYIGASATQNVQWLYQNTHPTNCLEAR